MGTHQHGGKKACSRSALPYNLFGFTTRELKTTAMTMRKRRYLPMTMAFGVECGGQSSLCRISDKKDCDACGATWMQKKRKKEDLLLSLLHFCISFCYCCS